MANQNTSPQVFDVRPLGTVLGSCRTTVVQQSGGLRIVRLVMMAGRELPPHTAPGDASLICIEGRLAVTIEGRSVQLSAGQLMCFAAGQSHAVKAVEDSSALLTVAAAAKTTYEIDPVQEASEESFPASDPPARSPITGP